MRAEDCVKLETCLKIQMIRDKDMLDFQYAESIRETCKNCEEGVARGSVVPAKVEQRATAWDELFKIYGERLDQLNLDLMESVLQSVVADA